MRTVVVTAGLLAASSCLAQVGQSVHVITDETGTYLLRSAGSIRPSPLRPGPSATDTLLWTYTDPIAIAENVALAPSNAWVGQHLNTRRLQRFEVPGNGLPVDEFPGTTQALGAVHAARDADLAVYFDRRLDAGNQPAEYLLRAFRASSPTEVWSLVIPLQYDWVPVYTVKVSRDGQIVCCLVNDTVAQMANLYIIDGADGTVLRNWVFNGGTAGAIDVNDDGSLCLVTQGSTARLVDTTTATEVYTATGSGAGGRFRISGNGDVLVIGGFSLSVHRRSGPGVFDYAQVLFFNTPTSWFGWGSAVSRDGNTVGVMSHDYASGYNNRAVRMWDLPSNTLIGEFHANGTGSLQGSISGGEMSDDGSVFAVSSWGTQDNAFPEVLIFDRQVNQIGSIDTPGSVFGLSISADGAYVLAGSKSIHANTMGNGGQVDLYQVSLPTPPCYANCDGSTTAPILNVDDFTCFINEFASAQALPHAQQLQSYANCDASTTAPVLNVDDFTCFINTFAAGCP